MTARSIISLLVVVLIIATACARERHRGTTAHKPHLTPLQIDYPHYVPKLIVPAGNETTVEGVALGRRIYYDPLLSQGGPLNGNACASCHAQAFGFAKVGPKTPPVMPHVNLGWTTVFLWDGHKQGTLEQVMTFEAEEFFKADLTLFQNDETYRQDFKAIYGDDTITYQRIGDMLAQFLRTVNSFNSPADKFLQRKGQLSESEQRGYEIFTTNVGNCSTCHTVGRFTDGQVHNIGLNAEFSGYDRGHYTVTNDEKHMGAFRTPTLRNVALRGPYMHDGRFSTLEEVVEFYNSGVKPSPALDPMITRGGEGTNLNLSEQQKTDLVNFMKALTDTSFTNNPDISKPRRERHRGGRP
jgi:cytochrome c peroxidase